MCLNAMDASPNMTLQEFWKDHFDIYKCIKNVSYSWDEVTQVNLNAVWKNVCPHYYNDFKGFDQDNMRHDMREGDK